MRTSVKEGKATHAIDTPETRSANNTAAVFNTLGRLTGDKDAIEAARLIAVVVERYAKA